MFDYDRHADVFLLAYPNGKDKALSLAAFSLETMKWERVVPKGPAIPQTKNGKIFGYYDPRYNAFVVQGRRGNRMWVYRHSR